MSAKNLVFLPLLASFVLACGGSPAVTSAPAEPAPPVAVASATAAAPVEPATPAATAAPQAPAEPVMAPKVERVAPTLKGTITGKSFDAGSGCAMAGTEPGVAYVEIFDAKTDAQKSCGLSQEKGARKIGFSIPWKAGQKLDVATLVPKKSDPTLFVMERVNEKKADRKDAGKDFKPTGSIEIVRVAGKDGIARVKVVMTSGKDKIEGEVDVEVKSDIVSP